MSLVLCHMKNRNMKPILLMCACICLYVAQNWKIFPAGDRTQDRSPPHFKRQVGNYTFNRKVTRLLTWIFGLPGKSQLPGFYFSLQVFLVSVFCQKMHFANTQELYIFLWHILLYILLFKELQRQTKMKSWQGGSHSIAGSKTEEQSTGTKALHQACISLNKKGSALFADLAST